MTAYLLSGPEKTHRFADLRTMQRVAELFQTYLALETLTQHPPEDDLRLGNLPAPSSLDRPSGPGDDQ